MATEKDILQILCKSIITRAPRIHSKENLSTVPRNWGAIHTSELDLSEIDLSPKRSECERSNAHWDRSKIDLNECEHFLKANWDRSQIDPTLDRS